VDAREVEPTEEELRNFLVRWAERSDLKFLWSDTAFTKSLLIFSPRKPRPAEHPAKVKLLRVLHPILSAT